MYKNNHNNKSDKDNGSNDGIIIKNKENKTNKMKFELIIYNEQFCSQLDQCAKKEISRKRFF